MKKEKRRKKGRQTGATDRNTRAWVAVVANKCHTLQVSNRYLNSEGDAPDRRAAAVDPARGRGDEVEAKHVRHVEAHHLTAPGRPSGLRTAKRGGNGSWKGCVGRVGGGERGRVFGGGGEDAGGVWKL